MFSWLESWDFIALFMTVSSIAFMVLGRKYAQTETAKRDILMRTIAPACAGVGYVILHYYIVTH